jgi:hypothetical protein
MHANLRFFNKVLHFAVAVQRKPWYGRQATEREPSILTFS